MRICLTAVLCFFALTSQGHAADTISDDKASAVILAYHRIGEDQYPDTNLRLNQFKAHLQELKNGNYSVRPLPEIIDTLREGGELPPKTVAITFEGAYKSALSNAIPLLTRNDIPFTLFFATDHADSAAAQHLNWRDIQKLSQNKTVSFGLLPASYVRLAGKPKEDILSQINKAKTRYRERLGEEPALFSYPFGEYSLAYKNLIQQQGFKAAFGLHSGTAARHSDFFALPRFTMTESFGGLERFRLVTNALPLPVTDTEPNDPFLTTSKPAIGMSVSTELANELGNLSCFISGQSQPGIEILGKTRVELRVAEPLSETRTRVNCTLPGPHATGETPGWRWFGMLLVQKETPENH